MGVRLRLRLRECGCGLGRWSRREGGDGDAFFLCRVVGVKNVLGFWDNGRGMMVLLGLVVFICSYAMGLCCVCKGRKYIHSKLCYADATKCLSTRCKSSASRGRI